MSDESGQVPEASDVRWLAITTRDVHAAPPFVYGVITTGVYCRPGCAARQPRRGNVDARGDVASLVRAVNEIVAVFGEQVDGFHRRQW